MSEELALICSNEENILEELRNIRDRYNQLKIIKHLQMNNDEIKELKKKINQLIHYPLSLKIENSLIEINEFENLSKVIRSLDFEFTHSDEFYWSKQFQYENSLQSEKSFHHHQDYFDEIKLDLDLLSRAIDKPLEEIGFIGSGPLPMTSITLLNQCKTLRRILNIDYDSEAIELSKSLIEYNKLNNQMDFLQCSAEELTSKQIENCQVLFIAILVGNDRQSKINIFKHLYEIMSDGMIILIRAGRGLKQILYPPIDMIDMSNIGFKPILEFHPYGKSPLTITKLIAQK